MRGFYYWFYASQRSLFNKHKVLTQLALFSIIVLLILAHLYIKFKIRDIKIQTHKLQRYKTNLEDVANTLTFEVGELAKGKNLEAYAQAHHMKEVSPSSMEFLTVPIELVEKYQYPIPGRSQIRTAEQRKPKSIAMLLNFLLRLIPTSQAEEK